MTERTSLTDFQAQLARTLADAEHRPSAADWLGVAWQGRRALLPLAQAGEIFQPLALQRLPHTQPWVQGVASLRGGVALVVDWVALLRLPPEPSPAERDDWADDGTRYWVGLSPALGVPAALCADRLLGLNSAADLRPEPEPPAQAVVRRRWRDEQGQRWYELDLLRLTQSPEFLDPRQSAFAPLPPR